MLGNLLDFVKVVLLDYLKVQLLVKGWAFEKVSKLEIKLDC